MAKIDKIIRHIPDWIKMAHDNSANGYKLLEGLSISLDEANELMDELENNLYIATANTNIPDYIHKIEIPQLEGTPSRILTIETNVELVNSTYKLLTSKTMVGMFDRFNAVLYINNYDNSHVKIDVYEVAVDSALMPMTDNNGNYQPGNFLTSCEDTPVLHHIWNCFDEFALLFGIRRLDGERNIDLKRRIVSAILNPPGSNRSGMASSLARELDTSPRDISFKTFEDMEVYNKNNDLSEEFLNYINTIKDIKTLKIAKWDTEIIDDSIYSVQYVPRIYNNILDEIPDKFIKSGIGDVSDLVITAPQSEKVEQPFNCYIGLTADKKNSFKYYPRHEFRMIVRASGIKMDSMFKPKDINFTVLASPNREVEFSITARQSYNLLLNRNFVGLESLQSLPSIPVDTANIGPAISNSVEIVPSNKLFHAKNRYFRVKVDLEANNTLTQAPNVKLMSLSYTYDTNKTGSVTVPLNTPQDNVKNDETDGSGNPILTIQKGEYYKVFASSQDFRNGGHTDEHLIFGTSVGIYLPKMQ